MPVPRVEKGKWSKERERTKSGRWRRKRSDANTSRKKSSGIKKYALAALLGIAIVVVLIIVLFFPQIFGLQPII